MSSFSPPVKTEVSVRPTRSIRKQGSLTTLDEDVVEIVENTDSYTVSVKGELSDEVFDKEIPKDWVSSVDLEKDTISYYPPSDPVNVFDVDVKSYSVEDEDSDGLAEKVKIQFTCIPNDLTHVLDEDRLADFRNNYYLNDKEISDSEFEDLKKEITEIPVKKIDKGSLEKTQTRPITPPTKGGKDWIDRGESNQITFTATLDKDSPSHRQAKFETGSFSQEWIVDSETDWYSNASDSEVDVRTTVDSGQLKLFSNFVESWYSFDSGSNNDGTNEVVDLMNNHNGTHKNFDEDEWVSGYFGSDGALDFDGVSDRVNIGYLDNFTSNYYDEHTFLMRVKPNSNTTGEAMGTADGRKQFNTFPSSRNGRIEYSMRDKNDTRNQIATNKYWFTDEAGNWMNIGMVCDPSGNVSAFHIYVNGTEDEDVEIKRSQGYLVKTTINNDFYLGAAW